jgi:hypothetical protein
MVATLGAFLALAALPDLVPARWPSADPATLELIRDTPVNCLLIEEPQWSVKFNDAAAERGVATLAVIRPAGDVMAAAQRIAPAHFAGAVLEGAFDAGVADRLRRFFADSKLMLIELPPRARMRLDGGAPIVGTYQGVWPGVETGQDAKAAPSGAPWIDTNTGFLRYVRAAAPESTVWIANTPPTGQITPAPRYLQAVADAAITGARWVVALDPDFSRRLLERETRAVADWGRICGLLRYYEDHKEWRKGQPFGQLALVEDASNGALLSGGVLDMIAVKHTPVRPIPTSHLNSGALVASKMAVNVDPDSLNDHQKEVLKAFTRAGGTLLTGPPGWKFPQPKSDQITLEKDDLKKLDEIWRELNSLTGRRNLGARLFNVSSMLSNLTEMRGGEEVLLQLANYSDFPVENVTVHMLGRYSKATLLRPGEARVEIAGYEIEEGTGTGYDIDRVGPAATLILTK